MIKLLAHDIDGTLLQRSQEIPQAHIDAILKAIEKGVKLVLYWSISLWVLPYKKLGLDLQNEYVIVNNGRSSPGSDWGLVDWREQQIGSE